VNPRRSARGWVLHRGEHLAIRAEPAETATLQRPVLTIVPKREHHALELSDPQRSGAWRGAMGSDDASTCDSRHAWWVHRQRRTTYLMSAVGVLSQYQPDRVFTSCGWDAQSASLLFKPMAPTSILLLGMGGGTAARQCRHLFPSARITAIESDRSIVAVARRHFDIDRLGLEVICCRAEDFLTRSRQVFDAIIDDAWPVSPGQRRAALDAEDWGRRVLSRLHRDGVLAVNLYSREQCATDHARLVVRLSELFSVVREVGLPGRLTTVLVAGSALHDGRGARAAIPAAAMQEARHALSALSYRTPRAPATRRKDPC
jgi:predicted O-methyltransferase YrrM